MIFQTAILLAAAVGVCMLALGMGRKKELPFVPFLLAGYLHRAFEKSGNGKGYWKCNEKYAWYERNRNFNKLDANGICNIPL